MLLCVFIMRALTYFLCAFFLLPVASILWSLTRRDGDSLMLLAQTQLGDMAVTTFLLVGGVLAFSAVLGTLTAWWVTRFDFAGRRFFTAALLLPLALPPYLLAMVYTQLFSPSGAVQHFMRESLGLAYGAFGFHDLRSLGGAIFVLGLSLYPYVYLLMRQSFQLQSAQLFDVAATLGVHRRHWLGRIALPLGRPALIAGLALVAMESIADFGTVQIMGVRTFSVGIYQLWAGMGDAVAASKLAGMVLLVVFAVLALERSTRRRLRHSLTSGHMTQPQRESLRGIKAAWMMIACSLPVLLGCVLPVAVLLQWGLQEQQAWHDTIPYRALGNSLIIAALVVMVTALVGFFFAHRLRAARNGLQCWLMRLASFGYAIPGMVVAVGVMVPMVAFDRWWKADIAHGGGLLLSGSIIGVVLACSFRFLALMQQQGEAALAHVPHGLDDTARLLGASERRLMFGVHFPLISWQVLLGACLVFADAIKELPATLMLRPFNFDTLAVRAYDLASDGQMGAASVPALMLVTLTLLLAMVVHSLQRHSETTAMKQENRA